jgi:hypothetical protein
MFEKQQRFLGEVFSRDALTRAIPAFAIVVGPIVFGISYLMLPTHPLWHEALKSLGQAILISGVVSTLLTSLTYIGIFQHAVHDVLYGSEYLKTRTDLPDIWSRVTAAICQEQFPVLKNQLQTRVLDDYIPTKKNFYYSRCDRECVVSWADKNKNIVNIEESTEIVLVPSSLDEKVTYAYEATADSRNPAEIDVRLDHLEIGGDANTYANILKEEEYTDEFGGKGKKYSYNITLSGQPEYFIRRLITRKVALSHDPVGEYTSNQFILNPTLKVRWKTDDLKVIFVGVGAEFEDKSLGLRDNWNIRKGMTGLLFPRQGYILFTQHAPPPAAGVTHATVPAVQTV